MGIISVSGWLFKKKSITMHGNMNVKFTVNDWCEARAGFENFEGACVQWNVTFTALECAVVIGQSNWGTEI